MVHNDEILRELMKYTPKGYIQPGEHIPAEGKGPWYVDTEGARHLDFTSGIFTNTLGHCPDPLVDAGQEQAGKLSNIHGRHCTAELAFYSRLFPLLPAQDYKAIPYNDGGYTIDRGLSDIVNYFNRARITIAAYRGGFHGKTQAAKLLINETEKATFFENTQLEFPNCYHCPWGLDAGDCGMACVGHTYEALKERRVRALIFEPVQGAQIVVPPKGYWEAVAEMCRENGILLFADEVLTGGGRCGSYLACDKFGIVPDMVALTKGLANGKPLSLLLERAFITENPYAVRPMERSSTFAAHPEALAVAAELLVQLKKQRILENVRGMGEVMRTRLTEIYERHPVVGECRCIGLMAAVEFSENRCSRKPDSAFGSAVFEKCRQRGLEVIYSSHILRLAPPLNISRTDLEQGLEMLEDSIRDAE